MKYITRNRKRNIVLGVILLIFISISTERVVAYQINQITHPPRATSSIMQDENRQPVKRVTLNTSDGLKLAAWYIPSQNGAAIIVQHGYRANAQQMLPIGLMLARNGYGVLLFDFRGHGESQGDVVTLGLNEVKDTDAALNFLLLQQDVAKIGLLGNSMGGATGVLATVELKNINAIAIEGVFSELRDEVGVGIQVKTFLPPEPFASVFIFITELETGYNLSEIAPIKKIGQISPLPILIMQGGGDQRVGPKTGEKLYAAANEPKEYWYEPNIAHVAFYDTLPNEYEKRVIVFFNKYLK